MAEPATDTTYPGAIDPLPHVPANASQNEPGLEHDVVHTRANAVLNALMAIVGTTDDTNGAATVLGRLLHLEAIAPGIVPINLQSGTGYVLAAADVGKLVCMSNASPNTLTVPLASSVPFPVGARVDLSQDGTGQTTIAKASPSIVINTPETLKLRKRFAKATLINRGPDVWDLEGNLEAIA